MDSLQPKKSPAKQGQTAQAKGQRKPPKRISADYLRNAGLYYLQRFAASRAGFETVMLRKVKKSCRHHTDQNYEQCAAMVRALADDFERAGLLNDPVFARGLVTSLRRSGKSSRAVRYKLALKGLPEDLATQALQAHDDEHFSNENEADLVAGLMLARRKKTGPFAPITSLETENNDRVIAAFARAGFSYDIIKRVLAMPRDEAEDLLAR